MSVFIQTASIKLAAKGNLDTRTQGLSVSKTKDTRVIDFGLDKGITINAVFGTEFKGNSRVFNLIPNGATTGFKIRLNLVEVGSGKVTKEVVARIRKLNF